MASLIAIMSLKEILKETFKLFHKNGRIFTSIALFTLLINSIGYLCNIFTIIPLITDLAIEGSLLTITKSGTPESTQIFSQITKDSKFIIGFELIYMIITLLFSCLSTTATILACVASEKEEEELSLKDLIFRTLKTWLRPLVTLFYTLLFAFIFFFIFGLILGIILLTLKNPSQNIFFVAIPLGIVAMVLYMYVYVSLILGIVVSAIEDTKGIEAIRRAKGMMIKGMKKKGFMLNLLVNMVIGVLQVWFQMIPVNNATFVVIKGMVLVCLISLVNMYYFATYVVIYYMCKKNVELDGNFNFSSGYSKIPTTPPLVDDKLP